ncbi:MAG: NAD(P)H-quinone oxidoreductase subunit 3 [Candidatus Latescibacteria bacterium]|nr:NAD(P)H-quinone oxidoreductase subunit 3 [Candidatus Latescibacterota bacterium]NIM66397.1 NAD(P)H-quinone oxidoreductase subunit 3 [Candidatus Latescibacterota bacterium]NIO02876.1 NAD(P)H-quinone oxidoreductase subunit 3 [Candidatus Latescibacterota bacterium]NIO30011.1 NAD(P)H-quinone oxidoreductase subunit 3 [Candidatus Latescibacterota bacterium]NIO57626.1 NAD(P)H-quinone oxidoreductase subunit 3 [Candidatus Latescibacterota bacterium]
MYFQFANVIVFLLVGMAFVGVVLFIGRLFRPSSYDSVKSTTYECGEEPVGSAWINYNSRFFLIALIFLIFEVEVVFIFPVAVVFRNWIAQKLGMVALVEILVFVLILFVGLIYAWAKGDLDWIKPTPSEARGAKDV